MRALVVGGGSAGHVIPALPVIAALQARGYAVDFVGTYSGLEEDLTAAAGVTFHAISAGKLRRYFSWQNFTDLFRIARGCWQAFWLLGRVRPDVVFSKGGFVSFPVALASWLRRVPLVAHESDLTPGLANRLVLPFARTLCVSFAETAAPAAARVVHTGTPIRASMLEGDAQRGRELLGLHDARPLLIVTGGSLGADALNAVVRDAAAALVEQFHVLHVCGPGKLVELDLAGYQQREYVGDDWGDMMAAADIVVSRAGANALFELLALEKPNVLVPLSAKASRGDQLDNAAFAERIGCSTVVFEENLDAATLRAAVAEVWQTRDARTAAMAALDMPDAVSTIVAELEQLARP